MICILESGKWPTVNVFVAQLAMPLDNFCVPRNIPLRHWIEDGLGPARGCGFLTRSNHMYLLEELEHLVVHRGVPYPTLSADRLEVEAFGQEYLVLEFAEAVGLARSDFTIPAGDD